MKTRNLLCLLVIFSCFASFLSCSDDDSEVLQVTVSSNPAYSCIFYGCCWPTEVMQISEDLRSWDYLGFGEIEGFQYERGYEYVLRIKKSNIANPPADAPSVRYELLDVLSKEKKEHSYGILKLKVNRTVIEIEGDESASHESLKAKVLADIVPVGGGYQFTYIDPDNNSGDMWTYAAEPDVMLVKAGTFVQESLPENTAIVYTLTTDGKEILYSFDYSHEQVVDGVYTPFVLVLDITRDYKAEYPEVESIIVKQYISFVGTRQVYL